MPKLCHSECKKLTFQKPKRHYKNQKGTIIVWICVQNWPLGWDTADWAIRAVITIINCSKLETVNVKLKRSSNFKFYLRIYSVAPQKHCFVIQLMHYLFDFWFFFGGGYLRFFLFEELLNLVSRKRKNAKSYFQTNHNSIIKEK